MNFTQKLDNYAQLIVCHGINVQAGQDVNLTCEWIHRELAQKIAQAAYKRGARFVNVDFVDPALARLRIQESKSDEYIKYVPRYIQTKFEDFVDNHSCIIRFQGSEDPDSLSDLSAQKVNSLQFSIRHALKHYYEEGVAKSKIHWTVVAAATPRWGKKVFPELSEEAACDALWEAIFKICRVDRPDFLEAWKQHNRQLHARAEKLTKFKIKELHFQGPGTDLKVYLSPKAIFRGGGDECSQGHFFEPNMPTEECFTTPDYRHTTGFAKVTRPVFINGKLVQDLHLEFDRGVLTHFTASQGEETFAQYIQNDEGGRRLGEVALVGTDSPIYQSKRVFQEILYDENAACHIALGLAYRFCLENGPSLAPKELEELGCNVSNNHIDLMISDEKTQVTATTYSNEKIPLIVNGSFKI